MENFRIPHPDPSNNSYGSASLVIGLEKPAVPAGEDLLGELLTGEEVEAEVQATLC